MTHFLTTQISHHGYTAVFLLMVLESACIPIPSEVIMLFGGALAGGLLAAGHPHVSLLGIGISGAVGNLAGSLIAYAVGRAGGRPLVERYGHYVLLRKDHIDKAEAFFARRGDVAVLVGRVLPVVRTFISLPAGVAEMPLGRFTLYTLIGCLPWTFALAGAGDALASNWDSVTSYFTVASVVIAVVVVAVIVRWLLKLRRQRSQQTTAG
ncbi:DedA family protein [Acidiferrimicrobium sp. IK]|uniref:DedA family protein n=1 Tax=Acidiferrimicrobium sp. IK TaxID=2871700 RepID=UPI0021CB945B|nr:DedA family protein [Acidiferrimicrobium sp. IK]MCU4183131.1 DedA family protein [Acidiferrimicrobium sp. IK]